LQVPVVLVVVAAVLVPASAASSCTHLPSEAPSQTTSDVSPLSKLDASAQVSGTPIGQRAVPHRHSRSMTAEAE